MKICLVSEEFPPETGWGGIGTHTYNLAHAMAALGHPVSVVSKSVDGKNTSLIKNNLSIHRIVDSDLNATFFNVFNSLVNKIPSPSLRSAFLQYPLNTLRRSAAIAAWIRENGPFDIIEYPDYGGEAFWGLFKEKIPIPVVVKLHTPLFLTQRLNSVPDNDIAVRLRKWMEKYSIMHATKLISPTKSLSEIVGAEYGIPEAEVLPNCIDTEYFSFKEKEGQKKDWIIMYAGRLERRKGVELLAKAIPLVVDRVPNVKIQMVGRDTPTAEGGTSMKAWLNRCFEERGISRHVEFAGEVPKEKIVGYYQNADACVLPSLWENLPYTCLEAMSCGTPVVGSNVGGFPEIITDGLNGFLFQSRDHEDLAKKILELINSEQIRALGRRARERIVTAYGHGVIAKQMIELYQKITMGRESCRS
ncbi:MAG: glycosyltransferase family 4 protein [Syntrophaceae bacterium]|nr:glycosyltransferase family 4 protein [Syntrophaceae bacterium]